jgi:two-component system sensor histidine kinase KdpD
VTANADRTETRNADALLAAIQRQEFRQARGRLKVFLGMCPGVGKTYAMLEAARQAVVDGRDVVVGYVETHGREETRALLTGLQVLPRREIPYRGVRLEEFDLEGALRRRPELILVDELAHTNAVGTRHLKRWQDVLELLDAGIHVFTTLNVQHVESRADTVRQITGTEVRETVPDTVLDGAAFKLVDIAPGELLQRLREGKVYLGERAVAAAEGFFKEGNLMALRELSLRLVADHVGEGTREFRRVEGGVGSAKTGHRLLVAVGPSPTSETLIRWTRRMADSLHAPWLAVYVEGPRPLTAGAEAQLTRNLASARDLGAEVIATTDADLVDGLLRVARDREVSMIVVGKPARWSGWEGWRSERRLRRLMLASGDIDVQLVRAEKQGERLSRRFTGEAGRPILGSPFGQYLAATAVVAAVSVGNLVLERVAGPRVPGMVFLLVVVLLALFVGRGPVLAAGTLSALIWNLFFLPPRFTLAIERADDAVLLASYFVVAMVLGQLVARIRLQAEAERRREERATALYGLTRDLAEAGSRDEVVWQLVGQLGQVFGVSATVVLPREGGLVVHPDGTLELSEKERGVAEWVFRNGRVAGRFTQTLPGADAMHLPLASERKVFGVLVVGLGGLGGRTLPLAHRELLEAFARQAGLVLEKLDLGAMAAQARLVAESERLGRTLLNSISHELRTPLAASTSAVAAFAGNAGLTPEQRSELLGEIQEANRRLNRVVGNLLDVTRLEAGQLRVRRDWHDVRDLARAVVSDLSRELAGRTVRVETEPAALVARMDYQLMQQVLANLVHNAAVHTPAGTPVSITARRLPGRLVLAVSDLGPGIPDELLPRVFEKFSRGAAAGPGGTGLGLAIARGFVEAHGGTLQVSNRPEGGAEFVVSLPQSEPDPEVHEP